MAACGHLLTAPPPPPSLPVEVLVFSHRVSGANVEQEYFSSAAEGLSSSGDVTAATHKFSRLSELESLRRADGKLQFRLVYPLLAAPNALSFAQSSNPTSSRVITGYTPIDIPDVLTGSATQNAGAVWGGGLRQTLSDGASVSDGSSGDCCGWYAIGWRNGPYSWAGGSGIPAVAEVMVQNWVQLYVTY
jgi:hypothetical protein